VPFAGVGTSAEDYTQAVRNGLAGLPYIIQAVTADNAAELITAADAIMVGGGNTFKLLHDLYAFQIFDLIRERVLAGTPYVGWSAGSNITGATICTTNDMPIIQPQSFTAFGFLPFQINPHYINQKPDGHNGETRDQRLFEFVTLNPSVRVSGIPEGTALLLENDSLKIIGNNTSVVFEISRTSGKPEKRELKPDEDVSWLMGGG